MKLRSMRGQDHVTYGGEGRCKQLLVDKHEGKGPRVRPDADRKLMFKGSYRNRTEEYGPD
jgi:hypothetical protein